MVHDRRIDGEAYRFGNASILYMRAMTWWDHETGSFWTQPLGLALEGELAGTELQLMPSQITRWDQWLVAYPDTLLMVTDFDRAGAYYNKAHDPNFVLGLVFDGKAKGYRFRHLTELQLLNDTIVDILVVIYTQGVNYYPYVRYAGGQELHFVWQDVGIVDRETGSVWDLTLGLATSGPLAGEAMQPVPSLSIYKSSWEDFYPNSELCAP